LGLIHNFPTGYKRHFYYQLRNFFEALQPKRQVEEVDSPYTYVEASVTIGGVAFPNVVRKKGFIGSQSTSRPSLKIKLTHTDKKAGLKPVKLWLFFNVRT
jgi:hypothetical protein|tara:strand:- start:558 stop:857 length:300 start_codon:yes stop_codon:yes gene_type:complete